jgi:hypothetical protein
MILSHAIDDFAPSALLVEVRSVGALLTFQNRARTVWGQQCCFPTYRSSLARTGRMDLRVKSNLLGIME